MRLLIGDAAMVERQALSVAGPRYLGQRRVIGCDGLGKMRFIAEQIGIGEQKIEILRMRLHRSLPDLDRSVVFIGLGEQRHGKPFAGGAEFRFLVHGEQRGGSVVQP